MMQWIVSWLVPDFGRAAESLGIGGWVVFQGLAMEMKVPLKLRLRRPSSRFFFLGLVMELGDLLELINYFPSHLTLLISSIFHLLPSTSPSIQRYPSSNLASCATHPARDRR